MRPGARQGRFGELTPPGRGVLPDPQASACQETPSGPSEGGWGPWPVGLTDGLCQVMPCTALVIGHVLGPLGMPRFRFRCPLFDALAGVEDGRGTRAARAAGQLVSLWARRMAFCQRESLMLSSSSRGGCLASPLRWPCLLWFGIYHRSSPLHPGTFEHV
jgi:hypothetical protein